LKSPLSFRDSGSTIHNPSHHKQQVREAVHVHEEDRIDGVAPQANDPTFGATADGSREVQRRTRRRSAREDESAQRRKGCFEPIDRQLEALNRVAANRDFFDARSDTSGGIRKARAKGEEILLQRFDQRPDLVIDATGTGDTETGVQFIDLAVRIDARVGLRDTRVVEERRLAGVPGLRIDLQCVKL
jgi:hypothetical protein